MGRKHKHRTNKTPEEKKKPYYRAKSLTVGMLEDLCASIKDKALIVQISDREGSAPEKCLYGVHVLGPKKGEPAGLILAGSFSWTAGEGAEEDQGYADDDDLPFDPTSDGKGKKKDACSVYELEPACLPKGEGVAILVPSGEGNVAARP